MQNISPERLVRPVVSVGFCRLFSVLWVLGLLVVVCVWLCGVLGTFFVEIWNFINLN